MSRFSDEVINAISAHSYGYTWYTGLLDPATGAPPISVGIPGDFYYDITDALFFSKIQTTRIKPLLDSNGNPVMVPDPSIGGHLIPGADYDTIQYWVTPNVESFNVLWDVGLKLDFPTFNILRTVSLIRSKRNYGLKNIITKMTKHNIKQNVGVLSLSKLSIMFPKSRLDIKVKAKLTLRQKTIITLNSTFYNKLHAVSRNITYQKLFAKKQQSQGQSGVSVAKSTLTKIINLQHTLIKASFGHPFNAPWYQIFTINTGKKCLYPITYVNSDKPYLKMNNDIKFINQSTASAYYHYFLTNDPSGIDSDSNLLSVVFNNQYKGHDWCERFIDSSLTKDTSLKYGLQTSDLSLVPAYHMMRGIHDYGVNWVEPCFMWLPKEQTPLGGTVKIVRLSDSLRYQFIKFDAVINKMSLSIRTSTITNFATVRHGKELCGASVFSKMNRMLTTNIGPFLRIFQAKIVNSLPLSGILDNNIHSSDGLSLSIVKSCNIIWNEQSSIDNILFVSNRRPPAIHWVDGVNGWDTDGISPIEYLTPENNTDFSWDIGGESVLKFTIAYTFTVVVGGGSGTAQILMTSNDNYQNWNFGTTANPWKLRGVGQGMNFIQPRYYDADPDWKYVASPIDPVSSTPLVIRAGNPIDVGTSGVTITPIFGTDHILTIGMKWKLVLGVKDLKVIWPAPYGRIKWWQPRTTIDSVLKQLPVPSVYRNRTVSSYGRVAGKADAYSTVVPYSYGNLGGSGNRNADLIAGKPAIVTVAVSQGIIDPTPTFYPTPTPTPTFTSIVMVGTPPHPTIVTPPPGTPYPELFPSTDPKVLLDGNKDLDPYDPRFWQFPDPGTFPHRCDHSIHFIDGVSVKGQTIQFDFGTPGWNCTELSIYQSIPSFNGTWKIQTSVNGLIWTQVSLPFVLGQYVRTTVQINSQTFRYLMMVGIAGSTRRDADIQEIEFKMAGNIANMF